MLNRTNRTLSASFNRLNLGTRSLDLIASAFNGEQTLRTRHAHAVVLRDGMAGVPMGSMPIGMERWAIPAIPCSPSVVSQPSVSCVIPARVQFVADASPRVDRPVVTSDRPSPRGDSQPRSQSPPWQQGAKHGRKPFTGKRLYLGTGFARANARATCVFAAATVAAAGG